MFSLAYHSGVTTGITPPFHDGFLAGAGALFLLDSADRLDDGAVIKEGGIYVSIGHQKTSISMQIAALRRLLKQVIKDSESSEASSWLGRVVNVSCFPYPLKSYP